MSFLFRTSILLAIFFGLEKLLGFARQVLIAREFGLSPALDAFNAANNLPDLLFALISGGALAIAFIPVLSEYLQTRGRSEAWLLFSRVANLIFLLTAGLSIIIAVFAPQIVNSQIGIAPGFSVEQRALVAELMRLNLIATLLFSMSGLVMAGLQANQHFLLPAIAPSMYDVGTLVGVLILAPETGIRLGPLTLPAFGLGIYGLVYGVILGALLFLVIQIPGLIKYGFRWKASLNLRDPGIQQVLALMGPRVITVLFIQLIFIAQDNLASRVGTGAVTALVYGWLFMQVPETLIGTAIGTALLPTLSEQVTRREVETFTSTLYKSIQIILALTLPLTLLLSIVIQPVVELLGFDAAGTEMVVWTSRAFMLGLIGQCLIEVAARAFYAHQDARTPLLASGLTLVLFIGAGILLFRPLGAPGIALANSFAFTAEAFVLLFLINRRYQGLTKITSALPRIGAAALVGAAVAFAVLALTRSISATLIVQLVAAAAALLLGSLAVLPFIWKQELRALVRL
ncbi:MAG: murein biosynthesis integral membrane protein MurJ [Anaerolineales bacterium]|jgi:putative peptidoglycan lipid II flippase